MKERQNDEHRKTANLIQIYALNINNRNYFSDLDFLSAMAAMWENLGDTEEARKWRSNLEAYVFNGTYRYQDYKEEKEEDVDLELMVSYLNSFVSPDSKLDGILGLLQHEAYLSLDDRIKNFLIIEGLLSAYAIENQECFEGLLLLLGEEGSRLYPFVRGEIERFDYLANKKDFNSAANVLRKLVGWKQDCDQEKLAGCYFWGLEIDVSSIEEAIDVMAIHLSSKYPHVYFGSKDDDNDGVLVDFNYIDILPNNLENMVIRPEYKWQLQLNVLSFYCKKNIQGDLDNLISRMVSSITDGVDRDYKLAEIYNLLSLLPDDEKRDSLIWEYFGDVEDGSNFFVRISTDKPEISLFLLNCMYIGHKTDGKSGFDYSAFLNRIKYLEDSEYNTEIKIDALSSLILTSLCSAKDINDFAKKLKDPDIQDGILKIFSRDEKKYLHVIKRTAQFLMGRLDFEPSRKVELFNYLYGYLLQISGEKLEIIGDFILHTVHYAAEVNNLELMGKVLQKVQEIDPGGKYLTMRTISQAARIIANSNL